MNMTVTEAAFACGGKLAGGDPGAVITGVCTDSRKVQPGTLFVPIKGARADAHSYIPAVFAAGAAATLTQDASLCDGAHPYIMVENSGAALQRLAAYYRAQFSLPVVGVTGSVGKTTTKEMIALALSAELNVMKTEGNLNSQVGLPLTLFALLPEHEAAVVEMGMSDFGEMARLAAIARPKYAVMTNIGVAHLQQLKTRENILAEKLHIIDSFDAESTLILNADDELLAGLRGGLPGVRKLWYGTQGNCDFYARDIVTTERGCRFTLIFDGKETTAELPVPGLHNVHNALASLAVAQALGVEPGAALRALAGYAPLAMRQQVHHANGVTIIDDSYNASPDAVRGSIEVLCALRRGKCVAALADMLELGELEEQAHREVGAQAARAGVDVLVTVGERARDIARGAKEVNQAMDCRECAGNDEAVAVLKALLTQGDTLLVKGSRGMKTDEIVRALL